MKKLILTLLVAAYAVALPAGAADGKKSKPLTPEQKEFAEKHNLLKDGELDKKAAKGLTGADKEAFDKLFPAKKKKK